MSPARLSAQRLLWLETRLAERDRAVLGWLSRLRLATGKQLEALAFGGLQGHSRSVVRGRVLARLISWGLIESVDRRIGGKGAGSTSAVLRLSSAGYELLTPAHARSTKPYTDRFTAHTLAVTELAVQLSAATTSSRVTMTDFVTEPASWQPDGLSGYLKPDAYLRLQTEMGGFQWWVEVDLASESLPTLERKLRTYLDFVGRGQSGPNGVIPRVLVTTIGDQRAGSISKLVRKLPPPAEELFVVAESGRAIVILLEALRE